MRALRLRSALAAALGAHVAIALAIPRLPVTGAATAAYGPPELEVAVEPDLAAAEPPTEQPRETPAAPPATAAVAARTLAARATSPERETTETAAARPEGTAPPAPPASGEPWSMPSRAPIDLGIGDYWKSVALREGAARGAPSTDASTRSTPGGSGASALRDGLEARDVAMGLGASGPLIAAAHEAATADVAPDVGAATLEIESDAAGRITSARVVEAAADAAAWNDVAQRIVRLMASRPLRVAPGARGVRARLRIVAERSLPAGDRREARSGATSDDACDTTGGQRRCVGGLPAGASGTWGDLSNIGAKRSRVVRVRLLGESSI